MLVNLFFLDPQGLRQLPGTHLPGSQKRDDLLAHGFINSHR
jgi:hypothetical protein